MLWMHVRYGFLRLAVLAITFLVALPNAVRAHELPAGVIDLEDDFRVIVELQNPITSPNSWSTWPVNRRAMSVSPPANESSGMGNICRSSATGRSWAFSGRHLQLYLGDGAREHLETIREAVRAWNRLLVRNPIVLHEDTVSYALSPLPPNSEAASTFYGDGTSVLYFSPKRTLSPFGYVLARQETDADGHTHLTEADVFIWSQPGPASELDLLIALQHELGHALGLSHTVISGNVMSHNYRPAIEDAVTPFIVLGILPDYDDANLQPGELNLFDDPRYSLLLRRLVRPQAQDKTGILCMYPFGRWGKL